MKLFPTFYADFLILLSVAPHESASELMLNEVIPYQARSNLLIDFDWDVPVRTPNPKMLGCLNALVKSVFQKYYGIPERNLKFKFFHNAKSHGVHILFSSISYCRGSTREQKALEILIITIRRAMSESAELVGTWTFDSLPNKNGGIRMPLMNRIDKSGNRDPENFYMLYEEQGSEMLPIVSYRDSVTNSLVRGDVNDPLTRLACFRGHLLFHTESAGPAHMLSALKNNNIVNLDATEHAFGVADDVESVRSVVRLDRYGFEDPDAPEMSIERVRELRAREEYENYLKDLEKYITSPEQIAYLRANNFYKKAELAARAQRTPFPFGVKGPVPIADALQILAPIQMGMVMKSVTIGQLTLDVVYESIIEVMNKHYFCIGKNVYSRRWNPLNTETILHEQPSGSWIASVVNYELTGVAIVTTVTPKKGDPYETVKYHRLKVWELWLKSPLRLSYDSIVFNPYPIGHPSGLRPRQLNLWNGWRWPRDELKSAYLNLNTRERDLLQKLQNHIFNVLCDKDHQKFQFLMSLLARKFRNPEFRANACCCFLGHQGAGKSFFFEEILFALARPHAVKCVDLGNFFERFNEHYANKMIVFFDEATFHGANKVNSQLKNWITSDVMNIEGKFKDQKILNNFTVSFLVTNQPRAVPLGTDARRFAMFHCARNAPRGGNSIHHNEMFNQLFSISRDPKNLNALQAWFYQFFDENLFSESDLTKFGKFGFHAFPQSCIQVLQEHKATSIAPITQFWKLKLESGYHYSPCADYLLNALEDDGVLGFNNIAAVAHFDHISEEDLIKFPYLGHYLHGRRLSDFSEQFMDRQSVVNFAKIIRRNRYLEYKTRSAWLGLASTRLLYEEFCRMLPMLQRDRYSGTDYDTFRKHTVNLFTHLANDNATLNISVKGIWKARSELRISPTVPDATYNEQVCDPNHDEIGTLRPNGFHYTTDEEYWVLGSLEFLRRELYINSGHDTTPNKVHTKYDLDTLDSSLYSTEKSMEIFEYFQSTITLD